ncbi:MAG: bifunctional riboflavin kinase/FAD synthetase [Verrucomicrobiota bacterium]
MIIIHSFEEAKGVRSVNRLALGFFDGLHLGHASVILPLDMQNPHESAVLTFQTHPIDVVNPKQAPPLITGIPHKLKILRDWQIGAVMLLPFDSARAKESAEDFLKELQPCFPGLKQISVGEDFRFGHKRKGDVALLEKWAHARGIELHVIPRLKMYAENVSSTAIRKNIREGNLHKASEMLGRPFSLYGEVIHGDGFGHRLGYPTANIHTLDQCLPSTGVYAGSVIFDTSTTLHKAAVNIGDRPTIAHGTHQTNIEAHILDFDGDLYGQNIHIVPQQKLRDEQKFPSIQALQDAIQRDVQKVREIS